ncbi:hypothetical protein PP645_001609 [Vibrio vulnificus]|nr:hypothetical protein [Vibrio vulnificus]
MQFYAIYKGPETLLFEEGRFQNSEVDLSGGPLLSRGLELLSQIVNLSFNTFPQVIVVQLTLEPPREQRTNCPKYVHRWWSHMQRFVANQFDGMRGRKNRLLHMIWSRDVDASHDGRFDVALLLSGVAFRECEDSAEIEQILQKECLEQWKSLFDSGEYEDEPVASDISVGLFANEGKAKVKQRNQVFFELSRLTRTGFDCIDKQETLFVTQKGVVPFDLRRKKRAKRMRWFN